MKQIERQKTQKLINKIQEGNFDENDVDNLFMKLRAYSNGFKVFREISDFVAHNDIRDRGLTNQSLEGMYLSIKYFLEFTSNNKKLNLANPFPTWIKKLMIYQIEKSDELKLKESFKTSKERLKSRVGKGFKDNKNGYSILLKGKISNLTIEAIAFVMSFINAKEAYSQTELLEETIDIIKKNNFEIDISDFRKQSNYFTLCTLLLLHNTVFSFKGYKDGYCKISPEKNTIYSYDKTTLDENDTEVEAFESFGNLNILGYVTLPRDGKDVTIVQTIMSTNLKAEKHCDESLFQIESSFHGDRSGNIIRLLELNENIKISQNRQLIID
ncbi:hypothetical protein [Marinifilum sp.]|uniref:hypothetical protein n=1 Tax=Marinifilum sp. TaxID=2033137 RepID=UPI003BAB51C9